MAFLHLWHSGGSGFGSAAGALLVGKAVLAALTTARSLFFFQRGGHQEPSWMSSALLAEVQQLRQDLAALTSRVLALESQLAGGDHRDLGPLHGSPITVNYSSAVPFSEVPPFPFESPSASAPRGASPDPLQSSTSSAAISACGFPPSEAERIRVAEELGAFIRRSLNGDHRGASGRDKIKLSNRLYILRRDIHGQTYNPPRLFQTFTALKPLVKNSAGQCGDAVFIGVPSQWEARIVIRSAGLEWPSNG